MKLAVITNPQDQKTMMDFPMTGYQMVLSQEVLVSQDYHRFHINNRRHSHFIICDNGAAEMGSPIDFGAVLEVANSLDADEVALPDVLRDSKATLQMHVEYADRVPEKNRMAIPQGTSVEEWIRCFEDLIDVIDFRTVGIPKLLDDYIGGRLAVLKYMERKGWHTQFHVHLLGCNKAPLKEIRDVFRHFPWVRGIDTAAPFAYAQANQSVGYSKHVSYNWRKATDNSALAYKNLLDLLDACQGS